MLDGFEAAKNKAMSIYHEWNEITGVPAKGSSWFYEIEAIIEDAVNIGMHAALGLDYSEIGKDELAIYEDAEECPYCNGTGRDS